MRAFIFILSLVLIPLAGCGQKGPLYLPDEQQEVDELRISQSAP